MEAFELRLFLPTAITRKKTTKKEKIKKRGDGRSLGLLLFSMRGTGKASGFQEDPLSLVYSEFDSTEDICQDWENRRGEEKRLELSKISSNKCGARKCRQQKNQLETEKQ